MQKVGSELGDSDRESKQQLEATALAVDTGLVLEEGPNQLLSVSPHFHLLCIVQ